MNFISGLPRKKQGFNIIWVMDRLTKKKRYLYSSEGYVPCSLVGSIILQRDSSFAQCANFGHVIARYQVYLTFLEGSAENVEVCISDLIQILMLGQTHRKVESDPERHVEGLCNGFHKLLG